MFADACFTGMSAQACKKREKRRETGEEREKRREKREEDRKSTRLNSSHGYISYAVFRLKKKKKKNCVNICKRTCNLTVKDAYATANYLQSASATSSTPSPSSPTGSKRLVGGDATQQLCLGP